MIIKDQINIIEKYTNYKNLYNFLIGKNKLLYKCDLCRCNFNNITKKNKILYRINDFNNNLISTFNCILNKFSKLNLEELFIINNMNYYDISYTKCNLLFCNLCLHHANKKAFKLNIYNYENILFEYISYDFYKYIIMNNKYFIRDKVINNKNIDIKRIMFYENETSLELKYITINKLTDLNLYKLKPTNYKILNKIIKNDFNFDLEYLKEYLKVKYD